MAPPVGSSLHPPLSLFFHTGWGGRGEGTPDTRMPVQVRVGAGPALVLRGQAVGALTLLCLPLPWGPEAWWWHSLGGRKGGLGRMKAVMGLASAGPAGKGCPPEVRSRVHPRQDVWRTALSLGRSRAPVLPRQAVLLTRPGRRLWSRCSHRGQSGIQERQGEPKVIWSSHPTCRMGRQRPGTGSESHVEVSSRCVYPAAQAY